MEQFVPWIDATRARWTDTGAFIDIFPSLCNDGTLSHYIRHPWDRMGVEITAFLNHRSTHFHHQSQMIFRVN